MLKLDNIILTSSNGWYIESINFDTSKNYEIKNLDYKNGNITNEKNYLNGLIINISGKCNISLSDKSAFLNKINYGMHMLSFTTTETYFVETKSISFTKNINNPLLENFTFTFVSYTPYKYDISKLYEITNTDIRGDTTYLLYDDSDIQNIIDDITMQIISLRNDEFILRNYLIYGDTDDLDGSKYPTIENSLSNFAIQGNSISAVFPTVTYIQDFYMVFDSVTEYNLFKTDIEIMYYEDGVFKRTFNDFVFSVTENNIYQNYSATRSKLYAFKNINLETNILKIIYKNPITKGYYYNYSSTTNNTYFTQRALAIIIPNSHSYIRFTDNGCYVTNASKGIITRNNVLGKNSYIGELPKTFPIKTYYNGRWTMSLKVKFFNHKLYEVENV